MDPVRFKEAGAFMTITDIARLCSVSWHFAAKLVKDKRFPKPVKIEKRNYYVRSQVEKYLSSK